MGGTVRYTDNPEEARTLCGQGFEPVECSFGRDGSVVGELVLDHHYDYSSEEAVSVKAARLAQEGVRRKRFVVTGAADADQTYAILVLSGSIMPDMDLAAAIAEIDTDPVGRDIASDRYLRILIFDQSRESEKECLESTLKAIEIGKNVFDISHPILEEAVFAARQQEDARVATVVNDIIEIVPGKVALAQSKFWGFDVWYRQKVPIVVAYVQATESVTIGGCDKSGGLLAEQTIFELLGPEGLKRVFPLLDDATNKPGWGGRETVGGSPRGTAMSYEDAVRAFEIIRDLVA